MQEGWIDNYGVMERLGISPRTLQTYRKEGIVPYSKIKGIYYYKEKDIEDMLEAHYVRKKGDVKIKPKSKKKKL